MNGLVVWAIVVVATIIPLFKLLPHFGLTKYWAFLAVLPVFTVVLLWIMALKLQEREDT